jgi:AraC family transcriptional regulator
MADQRIERTLALIENSDGRIEPLSLANLANAASLSRSRFTSLFRRDVGLSPAQFVRAIKLVKAAILLNESVLSVKEVAWAAGFSDRSHFLRDFKHRYGVSPGSYRAIHGARPPKVG